MNNSENTEKKEGNYGWIKWVVIVILGVVAISAIRSWLTGGFEHVKDAELTEYDEDTLQGVLDGEEADHLLQNDVSPVIATVTGTGMSEADIVALAATLQEKYSSQLQAIVDKTALDAGNIMDVTLIMFAMEQGKITEARLNLYFQTLGYWLPGWIAVNDSVAREMGNVTAAAMEAINNSVECTEYSMVVSEINETLDTNITESYKVQINNSSKGGFLGLNKRKRSSETRESVRNFAQKHTRDIVYHPLCLNQQVDPTALAAAMATQSLAMQALYGQLQVQINMGPDPAKFVKTS